MILKRNSKNQANMKMIDLNFFLLWKKHQKIINVFYSNYLYSIKSYSNYLIYSIWSSMFSKWNDSRVPIQNAADSVILNLLKIGSSWSRTNNHLKFFMSTIITCIRTDEEPEQTYLFCSSSLFLSFFTHSFFFYILFIQIK